MMKIKYFIFLCIIFYTPAVNSGYTPEELTDLWDKVRTHDNQYITLADLKNYYGAKTYDEWSKTESFMQVLKLGDSSGNVWKLYFDGFIYCIDKDGYIDMEISVGENTSEDDCDIQNDVIHVPSDSSEEDCDGYIDKDISEDKNTSRVTIRYELTDLWDKVRTHDNQYITLADLKNYYGAKTYDEWSKTESFMKVLNLGDSNGDEWKLYFGNFKKCVYLNLFLDPSSDS